MAVTLKKNKHLAAHNNSNGIEIAGTDQFHVIGADGTRYLDFTSGWCVGNLGWSLKTCRQAIRQYSGPDYVAPAFSYEPWEDLASLLCSLAPGNMKRCFRATGGSEAVDLAMQIAMLYTGRKKFLSLEESYHGNTIGTRSIGASSEADKFPVLMKGCQRIKGKETAKKLDHIETLLRKKEFAAFILEPVQMNVGVTIPEKDFITGISKLCSRYGTLLIADEVACGFGRTGKLFASEHFRLKPDILCLAKAMSGGYAPIGATLTTAKVYSKVSAHLSAYSTYGWHPLSVDVTLAGLRFLSDNRKDILTNVAERSQQLRTGLSQMGFKKGGRLYMVGLAVAVDLEDKKYAETIRQKCQKNKLLVTAQESRLVLFPPLTVSKALTEKALEIISSVA